MRRGFHRYLVFLGAAGLASPLLARMRRPGLVAVAVAFMALPAGASGAVTGVLAGDTMNGQPIPCVAQPDGVRVCHGDESGSSATDLRLKSFDGTPLAVYVTLPPGNASGAGGHYPLVVQSHGWGAPRADRTMGSTPVRRPISGRGTATPSSSSQRAAGATRAAPPRRAS